MRFGRVMPALAWRGFFENERTGHGRLAVSAYGRRSSGGSQLLGERADLSIEIIGTALKVVSEVGQPPG